MENPSRLAVLLLLTFTILSSSFSTVVGGGSYHISWPPSKAPPVACGGGGECWTAAAAAEEDDYLPGMESSEMGMSRRILATSQYISYAALQRDNVPCSRRGASYYNCKTGAEANPYSRGCNAIAHCRS